MHRTIRTIVPLLVLLLGQFTVAAQSAHADAGLQISHAPAATLIAGDHINLTSVVTSACTVGCGNVIVIAHYDYGEYTATTTGTNASTQTLTISIPGGYVYYPEFAYWIEAFQTNCSPTCGTWHSWTPPTIGPPDSGNAYVVPVVDVTRFRVLKPNGTPAVNLPIVVAPFGSSGWTWTTSTDTQGNVTFQMPTSDSRFVSAAASPGYINMMFYGFDSWPLTPILPAGGVDLAGLGLHVGVTVNLGNTDLVPVDYATQDKTFTLSSWTAHMADNPTVCTQPAPNGQGGSSWQCLDTYEDYHNEPVVVATTIGGGTQTQASLLYQDTTWSQSTWAYTASGNAGTWFEGNGELEFEHNVKRTSALDSLMRGPNENYKQILQTDYTHRAVENCKTNNRGGYTCDYQHTTTADFWTLGNYRSTASGYHDQAAIPGYISNPGPDCTIRNEARLSSEHSSGESFSFGFNFGGGVGPFKLHVRSKTSQGSETGEVYTWQPTATVDPTKFHHLFVKGGWNTAANSYRCPRTNPGLVWSDTHSDDRTNPIASTCDVACRATYEVPAGACVAYNNAAYDPSLCVLTQPDLA